MSFATWSIRNPIPSILLFVLLSLAGIWSFRTLPVQELPELDLPTVSVTVTEPGAAPAQLETEVARRVEDSLASLTLLKHLRTSITDGRVSISAEFYLTKNLSDALIETKDAVDKVRSDLPADVLQPTVSAVRFSSNATVVYSISAPGMTEEALSWFVDDTLAKAVLSVPGVGRFDRIGGVQREVRVEVDPARLAALGVTASDVSRALRSVEQQSSGGRGQLGGQEQSVRTIATVKQASDLNALPISLAGGRQLRLDQVATVRDTIAERTQTARLNGLVTVGFQVIRAKGYDETKIAAAVAKVLQDLQAKHPAIHFERVSGSVDYTLAQYDGSLHTLFEGGALAIVVVFLFLRDWRATLIAAVALPLSILPTFAAMAWLGYALNKLTLLAMAIVVGILVDDAIVEVENIERHNHMGKPVLQAAEDAVSEIALAVIATTMSIVAVFLPTAFMAELPGLLFRQFGWTAVIAVLSSLVVARLLTPMMAAYLLKPKPKMAQEDGRVMRSYLAAIHWCLAHRKATLGGALVIFVGSIALTPLIPSGLIPPADRGYTTVNVELPPGSSIDQTLTVSEAARRAIEGVPGIAKVFTTVGLAQAQERSATQASEVRKGALIVSLADKGRARQSVIEKQMRDRLATIPGARFSIGSGSPGEKLSLILSSDDDQALKATAQALERQLRGVAGLFNIQTTASLVRPEIVVRPDFERAADRGVTAESIGDAIRVGTAGDFDQNVARLNLDNRQVYIRVQVADADRHDLDTISNMRVNGRDAAVPLSSVAEISMENGPSQIDRYDRHRYYTVEADLAGLPLGSALASAKALPAIRDMPSSVHLIQSGDAEIQGELISDFGGAIVIGVFCLFCVLVLLFKDFFQPITILSALPLSIGGAFVALLIAHSELDLPSMIGLVMLMGIVAKNSILLVEYAIMGMRDRGLSVYDAIVDACHKRARPIVMTTLAMLAGMAPIALGIGSDASFRQPMAVAVMGGLITSTALSLLVVPVTFSYIHGFEGWLRRRFGRSHAQAAQTVLMSTTPLHAMPTE